MSVGMCMVRCACIPNAVDCFPLDCTKSSSHQLSFMSKLCRYKVGHVEIVFKKDLADEDDIGHPKQIKARSLASAGKPSFFRTSNATDIS